MIYPINHIENIKINGKDGQIFQVKNSYIYIYGHKGIKNQREWTNHCKSNEKPNNIPTAVHNVYSNKGWVSWPHFLGKIDQCQMSAKNLTNFML